jgi:hypothetical protein
MLTLLSLPNSEIASSASSLNMTIFTDLNVII